MIDIERMKRACERLDLEFEPLSKLADPLADLVGCSRSTMYELLTGKTKNPSAWNCYRVAWYLQVDVAELFPGIAVGLVRPTFWTAPTIS